MTQKMSTYTMRVPEELKQTFEKAAKEMDRSGAQLLRADMKRYADWWIKNYTPQTKPKATEHTKSAAEIAAEKKRQNRLTKRKSS